MSKKFYEVDSPYLGMFMEVFDENNNVVGYRQIVKVTYLENVNATIVTTRKDSDPSFMLTYEQGKNLKTYKEVVELCNGN